MKSQQQGFTLVEIAIVLVIIGLLLGGVLKGQELIIQAKIKNIANDFNGVAAAVYVYQDRYKALPGDDNGAKARWTNTANGNRNGALGEDFSAATADAEVRLFWQHLRFSGLIGGDTASQEQPLNAVGGVTGVQTNSGPAATPDLAGLVVCSSNLSGKIANAVDNQLDDGSPTKGTIRGYRQTSGITIGSDVSGILRQAPTDAAYVDDGAALYTLCKAL